MTLRSGKELQGTSKATEVSEKEIEKESQVEEEVIRQPPTTMPPPSLYNPPLPFSQRLQKKKLDQQFSKFPEVFKKLHINIPFAEALEQMPSYVKFMKEILSKKKRMIEFETVALTKSIVPSY